jgi:acetyl esterase/lipase
MRLGSSLLPHPDLVVGVLADVVNRLGHSPSDTLDELRSYAGRPLDELFPEPTRVPRVRRRQRWRFGGLVSEDLVFRSPHEPLDPVFARRYRAYYPETHTVYARHVRPVRGSRPRLLYYHGYMQPETPIEELAVLVTLCRLLDVEVVQIQPPYHGRRTPRLSRYGGELYWTADMVRSFEALRQSVLDARVLLGWLLAQDPRPVGIAGLSLGGALSLALTCLEERFAFSVPLIAHMDFAALLADAPVLGRMRRDLRRFGWGPEDLADFQKEIGWDALRPRIPRERIFLFGASEDRFFRPELVEDLWVRWGRPRIQWYPCSHMGFVAHAPQAIPLIREFVDSCVAARPSLELIAGGGLRAT